MAGVEGFGCSITFNSGFCAAIINVDDGDYSRPAHDTTNDATPLNTLHAWRTKIPSKLIDPGELKITLLYDPNKRPPIDAAAETITVTLPLPIGGNSAATISGSGFLSKAGQKIPHDNLMMQDVVLTKSGLWTFTAGS